MAKVRKNIVKDQRLPFRKRNFYLLTIGLILIVIGYIFMAQPPAGSFWSLTLAPIILLIAYLIIVPFSIFYGRKKDQQ